MTIRSAILVSCVLGSPVSPAPFQQVNGDARAHELKATPKTVAWGHYDAKTPPVLRIKPGDAVHVQTLITNSPTRLERAGVPPDQVEQALRDIHKEVKDKGPGGHILTGAVYVEGAEPGDTLEVRIEAVNLALPYAYNAFGPRSGAIPIRVTQVVDGTKGVHAMIPKAIFKR
jgi:acetamidase/formamidase